jgi:DNA-binding response OmpR family regulator
MATVLVADDDDDIRELIAYKLQLAGHQVIAVTDGEAAMNTARDIVPDIAVIDVTMPGIDGLAVCAALRGDTRTAHIPVLLLSARAQITDSQAGLDAGAMDYLTKPFSPHDLERRVAALLSR